METPGDKDEQEHETSAKDRGSQPKTGALKVAVLKGQGYPSLISYHKSTCPRCQKEATVFSLHPFAIKTIAKFPSGMGWYCASVQFEGTDQ